MFRVEEIEDSEALCRFQDDWKKLLSKSKEVDVFCTYEWITTWIECFWNNKPISFFFIWNNDELIGLAPFLKDEEGLVACKKSVINPSNGHTRRITIIYSENLNEILNALLNFKKTKHKTIRIILKNIVSDSSIVKALPLIAKQNQLVSLEVEKGYSPIIRINSDWLSYINNKSRHFSRELRRKAKKIKTAGKVEFEIITEANQYEAAMQKVFLIEKNSWKEEIGTSLLATEEEALFYENIAKKSAQNGWLRIYLLNLNSQPIAYIYGLKYKNEYCALKTSYHQFFKSLSPGLVLFEFALRDSFENGFALFDFFGTESRWKNDFANETISQSDLCIFSEDNLRCRICRINKGIFKPFVRDKLPILAQIKKKTRRIRSLYTR